MVAANIVEVYDVGSRREGVCTCAGDGELVEPMFDGHDRASAGGRRSCARSGGKCASSAITAQDAAECRSQTLILWLRPGPPTGSLPPIPMCSQSPPSWTLRRSSCRRATAEAAVLGAQAWIAQLLDRARRFRDRLGDRRVGVDDLCQLLVAALQRHRRDQLGDHVAGAVADDVGAEDLAVLGVDDELDQAVFVVVDGGPADAAELLLADLDVVPGLLGRRLGEADAGYLRVAEGRAGDEVLVDRVGRDRRLRARPRRRPPRRPCGRAPWR